MPILSGVLLLSDELDTTAAATIVPLSFSTVIVAELPDGTALAGTVNVKLPVEELTDAVTVELPT